MGLLFLHCRLRHPDTSCVIPGTFGMMGLIMVLLVGCPAVPVVKLPSGVEVRGRPVVGPCSPENAIRAVDLRTIDEAVRPIVADFVGKTLAGQAEAGAKGAAKALDKLKGHVVALELAVLAMEAYLKRASALAQAGFAGDYKRAMEMLLDADPANLQGHVSASISTIMSPDALGGSTADGEAALLGLLPSQPNHSGIRFGLLAAAADRDDVAQGKVHATAYLNICPGDRKTIATYLDWLESSGVIIAGEQAERVVPTPYY